jgi:hypothetical protein
MLSLDAGNLDISDLLQRLDALPTQGSYGIVNSIITDLSPALLRHITRILTERFDNRIQKLRLTDAVLHFYRNDVCRIHDETFQLPEDFYRPGNDVFIKDFCIASQRMIPVGAQIMHETGVSRRSVLSVRGRNAMTAARFFLRTAGFAPFYEIHTHAPALGEFNEEGWRRCYLRIAEVLTVNPAVKGVFGSSWFFDPVIERVSPRLAYLRNIPVQNGALSICCGSDQGSISLATQTSETRRKLFANGQYLPTSYLLVWDRRSLLRWAATQRA